MSDIAEAHTAASGLSSANKMFSTSTSNTASIASDDVTIPITSKKSNGCSDDDKDLQIDVKPAEDQETDEGSGPAISSSVTRDGNSSGKDLKISEPWLAFASSWDDVGSKLESVADFDTTGEKNLDENQAVKMDATLKTPFVE